MKKAFSLIELILYISFFIFIWFASLNTINQFFSLNNTLKNYKEYKLQFLDFEKDFLNLITENHYTYYTWWSKIVFSWENLLLWYICSWNLQKATFLNNWDIASITKTWDKLYCISLSWYYQTWINLDLKLKFLWTGLDLHYYFK